MRTKEILLMHFKGKLQGCKYKVYHLLWVARRELPSVDQIHSLGNNQPLFVVDWVPIDNRNFASSAQQRGFGGGDYDYGNMAADIYPNAIESMNVLKGAAIYQAIKEKF